ncbi:MAG: hypothetical protein FWF66_03375 [Candidatus Bathyarchaeota archaeon]|nr:hypothetical protein [Candidatus Termiticorpusculum sp.]
MNTLVDFSGTLIMTAGGIANNNGGGGVLNCGIFSISGGKISNNTSTHGGGVYNNGYDFSMSGGEISGNTAEYGGGVYNYNGKVSLSDGGVICGNNAKIGGGVYNYYGSINMQGGMISGNTAEDKGGGVYNYFIFSTFDLSGGVISCNTANLGGGVCTDYIFNMSDSEISGNRAKYGGGVYIGNGVFRVITGNISGNTADHGGGVWVDTKNLGNLFVSDEVTFSNNNASTAYYHRDPAYDAVYHSNIGSNVTWTSPFTQGHNNYDISYTNDPLVNLESSDMLSNLVSSEEGKIVENGYYWVVLIIVSVLLGCIICVLFLYFKPRKNNLYSDP